MFQRLCNTDHTGTEASGLHRFVPGVEKAVLFSAGGGRVQPTEHDATGKKNKGKDTSARWSTWEMRTSTGWWLSGPARRQIRRLLCNLAFEACMLSN